MTPAEIALITQFLKFGTDIAIDMYIEGQNRGYTPDQLEAMITGEEARKKTLDAAWQQMKTNAGL